MLGSIHDAEDALQDALLRAWRGLHRLEDQRGMRAWLYRIATNVCLDAIARRPKRVLPAELGPASGPEEDPSEPIVESIWIDPYPDEQLAADDGEAAPDARYEQREAVELAFTAALQHLPATQRAVLILREVLGFSASEASETLETTVASVNSALQRARKTVREKLPAQSQQTTLRQLGDDGVRRVVERYVEAMERDDADGLAMLLAEDATFAMPPFPEWWQGRKAILAFRQRVSPGCPKSRPVITRANAQPAIGWFSWDERTGDFRPGALEVLDLEGERVKRITAFVDPELFPHFGLPPRLPG
jgi:RNA polymerase sigma-70 factor (ECF subfamily)